MLHWGNKKPFPWNSRMVMWNSRLLNEADQLHHIAKAAQCVAAVATAAAAWHWLNEECRAANLCTHCSRASQQASIWASRVQLGTTVALQIWSLQTAGPLGQIVVRRVNVATITSIHGSWHTMGHYWHVPAAEPHHRSCSVGGCVRKNGSGDNVLAWKLLQARCCKRPGPAVESGPHNLNNRNELYKEQVMKGRQIGMKVILKRRKGFLVLTKAQAAISPF